jgi:hypothetical protein
LRKICGVDIFNKEQRIEYENVQRKMEEKREKGKSSAREIESIYIYE